ncbi:MAG: amidinotransferase, partial [Pedobacter sp.]
AYACLSVRTEVEAFNNFCQLAGYKSVIFNAVDSTNYPIYHTNVMMCIGDKFAVICLDSIPNLYERDFVQKALSLSGKEIIKISFDQMNHFAGNMLQVKNDKDESLLVMSEQAYKVLNESQINTLSKYAKLIYAPLYMIEQNGGGSARCMLAEVHLPIR